MKQRDRWMGKAAAIGISVAAIAIGFFSFGVPDGGCGGAPAVDQVTQDVRRNDGRRREPGQDDWIYPQPIVKPGDGPSAPAPSDAGPAFGFCQEGPSSPGNDLLQCFAEIITLKPVRCAASAVCNGLEGREQTDTVKVCTEPLSNYNVPQIIPGNHVFACVDGPTTTPTGCEKLAHQCPPGQRVCLDDTGAPGGDGNNPFCPGESGFKLCVERTPRPGQHCDPVYKAPGMTDDQFAAQMCCMMQELDKYFGEYEFFTGNCGSSTNLLVQCAGGAMSDPGAANLGIGCGFDDRKFQPPQNPDGTSPPTIPGSELCKRLQEACTCTVKTGEKVH